MEDKGEQISIGGVHIPDYLRPVYANYANVNYTPWDFRITFAVVRSPVPGAEEDAVRGQGVVQPEAVTEVIVPATLMHGLISALQSAFARYLDAYGPPGLEPTGPRPPD
jgi:hypothetical protein